MFIQANSEAGRILRKLKAEVAFSMVTGQGPTHYRAAIFKKSERPQPAILMATGATEDLALEAVMKLARELPEAQ